VKANHKIAFLCVESTIYEYIEDLSAPKKWFKANVDAILSAYGDSHSITKEEVFLGTKNRLQSGLKCLPLSRQSLGRSVRRTTPYSSATIIPKVRCVRMIMGVLVNISYSNS
jgi:hypothetical protein